MKQYIVSPLTCGISFVHRKFFLEAPHKTSEYFAELDKYLAEETPFVLYGSAGDNKKENTQRKHSWNKATLILVFPSELEFAVSAMLKSVEARMCKHRKDGDISKAGVFRGGASRWFAEGPDPTAKRDLSEFGYLRLTYWYRTNDITFTLRAFAKAIKESLGDIPWGGEHSPQDESPWAPGVAVVEGRKPTLEEVMTRYSGLTGNSDPADECGPESSLRMLEYVKSLVNPNSKSILDYFEQRHRLNSY